MTDMIIWRGKMLGVGQNAKTTKGDKAGQYLTAILYLAPAKSALMGSVCANSLIAGCEAGCLNSAGRGAYDSVQESRKRKTREYFNNRAAFMATLVRDIELFVKNCRTKWGKLPAVRLNGTSDIQFEVAHPCYRDGQRFENIFEAFPEVMFYDYTKITNRVIKRKLPDNYRLTLSYSEANVRYAENVLDHAERGNANHAIVFRDKATRDRYMKTSFKGRKVINGDETDLRFLDPQGVVVGLYAKGKAKKDQSGFVID